MLIICFFSIILSYSSDVTATELDVNACVICNNSAVSKDNPLQDVKKGAWLLLIFAEKSNNNSLKQHLINPEKLPLECGKIKLHKHCQRYVYNQNKKHSPSNFLVEVKKNKILRSSLETFDWKCKCLFCAESCQRNTRHPDRNNCHEVTTLIFKNQVLLACQKKDDKIGEEVALRVGACNDLVAVEARYHTSCRVTFFNLLRQFHPGAVTVKKGRPAEDEKVYYFDQLCEWMEQEAECYTIKELHTRMMEIANCETVYSTKWLKRKLMDRYEEHVFFAELKGRSNVVCLKNLADLIVNSSWYENREKDLASLKESSVQLPS